MYSVILLLCPGYYFLQVDFVCVYNFQSFDKCSSQKKFILALFMWLDCRVSSLLYSAFMRQCLLDLALLISRAGMTSFICTVLWKRKSRICIVVGLSGEQKNWNVLGFHCRRMQSRASWEKRSLGINCSQFCLTLTLQNEDGGGRSHWCEIFLRKLRRTSMKLTMG